MYQKRKIERKIGRRQWHAFMRKTSNRYRLENSDSFWKKKHAWNDADNYHGKMSRQIFCSLRIIPISCSHSAVSSSRQTYITVRSPVASFHSIQKKSLQPMFIYISKHLLGMLKFFCWIVFFLQPTLAEIHSTEKIFKIHSLAWNTEQDWVNFVFYIYINYSVFLLIYILIFFFFCCCFLRVKKRHLINV